MKSIGLGFLLAVFSTSVFSQDVIYDYGTVVESVPIVKNFRVSTPREECWDEEVVYREPRRNNAVGTVLGAVIGGALGNAVGHHKKNKQVGAVVGAVLGGTIGHAISTGRPQSEVHRETEEVCRIYRDYHEEERIVGYRVRYRYNNETFTTRTNVDPGDTIKLRLSVSPVT